MGIKQRAEGRSYSVLFLFPGGFVKVCGICRRFNVPFDSSKVEEDEDALFVFDGVGCDCDVPAPGDSVVGRAKTEVVVTADEGLAAAFVGLLGLVLGSLRQGALTLRNAARTPRDRAVGKAALRRTPTLKSTSREAPKYRGCRSIDHSTTWMSSRKREGCAGKTWGRAA